VEGGQGTGRLAGEDIVGVANPIPGTYSLLVKARSLNSWTEDPLDAAYTLSVRAADNVPVAFDGGSATITNQSAGAWQHFVVEVPPDTQGWDVRLVEVVGGVPKLIVRRGELPQTPYSAGWPWSPYYETNWPAGYQIAASEDWTRRSHTPDWLVNENGRIFAAGMGNPSSRHLLRWRLQRSTTETRLSASEPRHRRRVRCPSWISHSRVEASPTVACSRAKPPTTVSSSRPEPPVGGSS
jgi:hypothetical protein